MRSGLSILISLSAIFFAMLANAQTAVPTKDVAVAINDVFVPVGFTSQSDAYVVVNGMFPNGCYRWKGADIKVISPTEREITTMATVSQGMCIMVLVPFTKQVQLGKLVSGHHTLRFMSSDGTFIEKGMDVL